MVYIREPKIFLITVLILGACILLLREEAWAQDGDTLTERRNKVIHEGIELVYATQYDEAIKHFKQLEDIDPESAEGLFFEAFVLELIMDIYRSQVFDDSLNAVLERAFVKAEKAIEKNPTARNYMFLGGVYGVRGVRKGILGQWFGSAMDGRRANKHLKESLYRDSTLYDCYYGVGTYNYWKTKKLKRFFGFFVPDRKEQGINELYLSIEKGVFAETPGRMALFRIFIEEKRYDDVIALADIVLKKIPEHIFPRWYLGIALTRTEQWEKARDNYQKIRDMLEKIHFHGIEAEIEAWYYQGLSYYYLGETQKAKELLEQIPQYEDKVNKKLFYYDDYMKASRKLLEKIG